MKCKSVMIVEDDEAIRESTKEALEFEGYHVLTAVHGKDALVQLEKLNEKDYPGMIILDLMMPEMDGYEFLNHIEQNSPTGLAKIPVVVASAKGSASHFPKNVFLRESLKKPMDLDELYRVVKSYCGEVS